MAPLGIIGAVVVLAWGCAVPSHARPTAPSSATVPVTVVEPAGLPRQRWPLTFSVPWPRGVLRDERQVAVAVKGGASLPAQTRVLGRWPDGSVRWLLIDTQVTMGPRESLSLTVSPGGAGRGASAARLVVTEDADQVRIDTGVLRAAVPKRHFGIVEKMEAHGLSVPGTVASLIERDGSTSRARTPSRVQILEQGPLRARIALEGNYGNGFDYLIRVEAYAGQPLVRVLHTFINHDSAPLVRIPRIALEWPIALPPTTDYVAGAESGALHGGKLDAGPVTLVQPDNEGYSVNGEEHPGGLAGWLALRAPGGTIGVAARWFWQQYPQSFRLDPAVLSYNLWDPSEGPALVGMGAAKTHELVLFAGGNALADSVWVGAVAQPLVASVDPAWIAQSEALPQGIAPGALTDSFLRAVTVGYQRYRDRNHAERWDDRGTESCDGLFGERPRVGAYGMWNWGDWNFPTYQDNTKGCDAWGNLEYDTTQVLALAFAATGRADVHEAMVVAARHFMDVDTIHYQRQHPEWVGMNHPKNPLHFSFNLGGIDLGHSWTEGLLSYYQLTGDERGLTAARGIADYFTRRAGGRILLANPRQLGWPQIALVAAYQGTGEEAYLRAARVYASRAMEVYDAGRPDHWKHGILADALAYTHAVTGDPQIEQWLRAYAHTLRKRGKVDDLRFLPALAYVARLSGDATLRELVLERAHRIDLGGWGKPFTINGRIGFRVYSILSPPPSGSKPPSAAAATLARRGTTH